MHNEPQHVDLDQLAKMGYEEQDISVPAIVKWIYILFAFIIGSVVITFLFYKAVEPPVPPMPTQWEKNVAGLMPADTPRLQRVPEKDIALFLRDEHKKLDDAPVPIDKAMGDVLAKGLPTRATPITIGGQD